MIFGARGYSARLAAGLAAGLAAFLTAAVTAAALGRFVPAVPMLDAVSALALVGVGLVLTSFATVIPFAARSRASVAVQLAAK